MNIVTGEFYGGPERTDREGQKKTSRQQAKSETVDLSMHSVTQILMVLNSNQRLSKVLLKFLMQKLIPDPIISIYL